MEKERHVRELASADWGASLARFDAAGMAISASCLKRDISSMSGAGVAQR